MCFFTERTALLLLWTEKEYFFKILFSTSLQAHAFCPVGYDFWGDSCPWKRYAKQSGNIGRILYIFCLMTHNIDIVYILCYITCMYEIRKTDIFLQWLFSLRDTKGEIAIARRIDRAALGNFGDCKGQGISEMRIPVGTGYRVYYAKEGNTVYILLCGGDKSTQQKDIEPAQQLWKSRWHPCWKQHDSTSLKF